ncbi:MAG: type II secretion system protein GspG [Planctomycetes bacterium]|nr:type II secretion system protein GspG [Planctomycetota bacterium]
MVLLAVILGLGIGYLIQHKVVSDYRDHTNWAQARAQMDLIHQSLMQYWLDHDRVYPSALSYLDGPAYFGSGLPKDPFTKSDYQYELTQSGFRLICLGKDQAPGGADEPDKDIVFDETGLVER